MARGHDLDAILAAITPRTRIVYLANPNNPDRHLVRRARRSRRSSRRCPSDVLVVVDEAYADYVDAPRLRIRAGAAARASATWS